MSNVSIAGLEALRPGSEAFEIGYRVAGQPEGADSVGLEFAAAAECHRLINGPTETDLRFAGAGVEVALRRGCPLLGYARAAREILGIAL